MTLPVPSSSSSSSSSSSQSLAEVVEGLVATHYREELLRSCWNTAQVPTPRRHSHSYLCLLQASKRLLKEFFFLHLVCNCGAHRKYSDVAAQAPAHVLGLRAGTGTTTGGGALSIARCSSPSEARSGGREAAQQNKTMERRRRPWRARSCTWHRRALVRALCHCCWKRCGPRPRRPAQTAVEAFHGYDCTYNLVEI